MFLFSFFGLQLPSFFSVTCVYISLSLGDSLWCRVIIDGLLYPYLWVLWKTKLILIKVGDSDSLKWESETQTLTWCLPEAPTLVAKMTWKQARLRISGILRKKSRIYSDLDHLCCATRCHGNMPVQSQCLHLTITREGLMCSLKKYS